MHGRVHQRDPDAKSFTSEFSRLLVHEAYELRHGFQKMYPESGYIWEMTG